MAALRSDYTLWLMAMFLVQSTLAIGLAAFVSGWLLKNSPAKRHTLWLFVLLFVASVPVQHHLADLVPKDWRLGRIAPVVEREIEQPEVDTETEVDLTQDVVLLPESRSSRWVSGGRDPEGVDLGGGIALSKENTLSRKDTPSRSERRPAPEEPAAATATEPTPTISPSWIAETLSWIWAAGVALGLLRLLHGFCTLQRIISAARPCLIDAVNHEAEQIRRRLRLTTLPRTGVASDLRMPMTTGLIRPTLLLPEHIDTMPTERLRHLLQHELAHVKRGDAWTGLLQRAMLIFFWPQPLLRYATAQLSRAREELCDNLVLRDYAACDYASSLVELAERCLPSKQLPAFSLFPAKWRLEKRVDDLLDGRRDLKTSSSVFVKVTTGLASLAALVLGVAFSINTAPAIAQEAPAPPADDVEMRRPGTNVVEIGGGDQVAVETVKLGEPLRREPRRPSKLAWELPEMAEEFASIEGLDKLRDVHGPDLTFPILRLLNHFAQEDRLRTFAPPVLGGVQSSAEAVAVATNGREWWMVLEYPDPEKPAALVAKLKGESATIGNKTQKIVQRDPGRDYFVFSYKTHLVVSSNQRAATLVATDTVPVLGGRKDFHAMQETARIDDVAGPTVCWYTRKTQPVRRRRPHNPSVREGGVLEFLAGQRGARHKSTVELSEKWLKITSGLRLLKRESVPPESWVPADCSSYVTLHVDLKKSLPALKSAIDEVVDSAGFVDDVIDSYRDDRAGPRVDLRKDLFAWLGDRVSFATANGQQFASIHITNMAKVAETIDRLFRNEPQAGDLRKVGDAWLLSIKAEPDGDANNTTPARSKPSYSGGGLAIVDQQLLLSSNYADLERAVTGPIDPQRRVDLAKALRRMEPDGALASGRVYARRGFSTLPPFGRWLRFGDEFGLPSNSWILFGNSESAISIRATENGFAIEGRTLPSKDPALMKGSPRSPHSGKVLLEEWHRHEMPWKTFDTSDKTLLGK